MSIQYRPEIDGLRALAVIPVVFFHAGLQVFGGGYAGVDIFFVISGFLITSIILAEKEAGTFSTLNFYERRARRILPALFFVMFVSIQIAWFWLLPEYMKAFSNSLIAVPTFTANFSFWRETSYFDTTSALKPLLHTWSLAVEEQFYVLFPLFLVLFWKFGKRWVVSLLLVIALLSLALTQHWSHTRPETAFYLLPTRGWELLVGVFVAFYFAQKNRVEQTRSLKQLASMLGFLLILYALFYFDEQTPFPSLYTLVPTIGTALVIAFATHETLIGKVLGNRILAGIGLISYSTYLWHQPLFAFVHHKDYEVSDLIKFAMVIESFLLAYFTWQYIEKPFRNKAKFTRKQIFTFAILGSTFFMMVGLAGRYTNGFESRFTPEQRQFLAHFDNSSPELKYIKREHFYEKYRFDCDFYEVKYAKHGNIDVSSLSFVDIPFDCYVRKQENKKAVFLWGDSHAQELYYGLKQTLPNDWQILLITTSGCEAKLGARKDIKNMCEYSDWLAHKAILVEKPEVVIVGQNLHHDVNKMTEIIKDFEEIGIKRVIFTGPTPHWERDLPKIVVDKLWKNTPRRTFVGLDKEILQKDKQLKMSFPTSDKAKYISISDYFCNELGCEVYLGNDIEKGITAWDYGHLTPIASYAFAKDILSKAITDGF